MAKQSTLKFPAGGLIVQDGGLDNKGYLILSGRVEIFKEKDGKRVVFARLGSGHTFGEMSLISERPRTASVVALEETVVRCFDRETFIRLLKKDPEKIFPFLQVMFERLRSMNSKYFNSSGIVVKSEEPRPDAPKRALSPDPAPAASALSLPVLIGLTPAAEKSLVPHNNERTIKTFPFKIGRKSGLLFTDVMSYNDLFLEDGAPYNISRNHCSINKAAGGKYFIQDRGSTLGTIVNGREIGGKLHENQADLQSGKNELILGLPDSPYRYEIRL